MIRPGVIVSLLLYARLLLALLLLPHLRLNIPPRQPAVPFRLNLGRIHMYVHRRCRHLSLIFVLL